MNRYDLINYIENKDFVTDKIKNLEEEKENVNKLCATYGLNLGASSEIHDRIAENLAKILDEYEEMQEKMIQNQNKFEEIEQALEKMENATYRNLLYKKYILGKSTEEIAVEIKKDYKYTCTMHGYALNEFDRICEKLVV